MEDLGLIPWLGRSSGEGKGYPLQFLGQENFEDCTVLKLNIQKSKIMESCPITSWQIDGETTEIVTDFIFWLQNLSGQLQTVVLLFNLIQLKPNSERGTPHGSEAVQANGRATIPPPLPLIFHAGLSPRLAVGLTPLLALYCFPAASVLCSFCGHLQLFPQDECISPK